VGEGWNQYMHDFTVSYPQCTNSTPETPDSDCGSVAWAYCVFIAWNLLSMYIFVNMFTGVVVENFSYVFQLDNSHNSIDRHQMRAFKKVWSSFDVDGTGYLNRASIVPFLAKLTGVFEVRIYPAEFAIKAIINECQVSAKEPRTPYSAPVVHGIDMGKLGETLNKIDHQAISQRRRVYVRLYHEAVISAESGKGISFTNMLLLLAHHKIIDDQNALRLDELLHRRATTDYVTDLVNLDRVRSLLRMIACRRRYLAYREAQAAAELIRLKHIPLDIPAIVVENSSASLHRSWDITTADKDFAAFRVGDEPPSPSPTIRPLSTADTSASVSLPGSPILAARPRHSDVSVLSGDFSLHPDVRRESIALSDATPQQVLSTLDASVWGEMMHEAAEDD
ncbi:calcium channel protein, partial [Tulasnella sp. 403]